MSHELADSTGPTAAGGGGAVKRATQPSDEDDKETFPSSRFSLPRRAGPRREIYDKTFAFGVDGNESKVFTLDKHSANYFGPRKTLLTSELVISIAIARASSSAEALAAAISAR